MILGHGNVCNVCSDTVGVTGGPQTSGAAQFRFETDNPGTQNSQMSGLRALWSTNASARNLIIVVDQAVQHDVLAYLVGMPLSWPYLIN